MDTKTEYFPHATVLAVDSPIYVYCVYCKEFINFAPFINEDPTVYELQTLLNNHVTLRHKEH